VCAGGASYEFGQDMRLARGLLPFTLVVALGAATPVASAQTRQPAPTKPSENPANPRRPVWKLFTDIGKDFAHLPSRDTLVWLGTGGALALATHPLDDNLNAHLTGSDFWADFFEPGKIIGYGATQFGTAVATYAWGRTRKEPKVVHLGVDLLRAQIVTQVLTLGVKLAVRRDRPDGTGYSFPSGHASVTFASATVLQRHLGWRAAVPTYTVASYVAISRLHENRHFLSDVTFGAALGIVAGRTVTRHGRNSWAIAPVSVPGGMAIIAARVR
jgi:membrane-associated phospholipid phosphatase